MGRPPTVTDGDPWASAREFYLRYIEAGAPGDLAGEMAADDRAAVDLALFIERQPAHNSPIPAAELLDPALRADGP